MSLFSGFNFQSYLADYSFWQDNPCKSKKIFKNTMRVLYGRKKDRGHLKQKYEKKKQKFINRNKAFLEAFDKVTGYGKMFNFFPYYY